MAGLFTVLTAAASASSSAGSSGGFVGFGTIIYIIVIGVVFYFLLIRPQKKQQKKQDALISSIEVGDSVVTTSGFYGVVIDIPDDQVIIVEFGNNKNCRIPMRRTAVVEVEKPEGAAQTSDSVSKEKEKEEKDSKEEKKSLFGKKKD
jgi:preprotein translocase subunit YajC